MSDREPYDRTSCHILWFSNYELNKKKKSEIEEEYYSYYKKISHIHLHGESNIRMLNHMLNNKYATNTMYYQNKIIEIKKQIQQCELLLSLLEATTPIQCILQKERKPNEKITLSYLNAELPEIPYNVIVSHPIYLTNEKIKLINDMDFIDIDSSKKERATISPQEIITGHKPILSKIKEMLPFALAIGIPILLLVLLSLYYN